MRTVKRIIKVHKIRGYKIYCLFNNGESRIIDFKQLFKKWDVQKDDLEWTLVRSEQEFQNVELVDGTLTWKGIEFEGEDDQGKVVKYYYDIDPIVLYENSEVDESRQIEIGLMIKQARNEMGLTQEQLAKLSGTTKHYISRVENNKTGIELSTLIRIIEGGLGKRMKISIQ
ncbi:MAG: helix-turn-helix domain-containing protein [Saprospiraceae bacterium]|nr:helix-turn-helix domain-containing protein [Saprospiraceae bacterium]